MADTTTVDDVTVIVTESLSKRYPRVTALDRLSLDIAPGVTGLVGANGAGKSTLIKILLGLAPATEGTAHVLGLDVTKDGGAIRERVGYMPEHDCLPPDVSATEFVVHMARMSGLPPTAARERTADTLRHVGLYEERYRPIGGYSTGMKQRVKLAQALVHDPQLVFLDEPTNGLDPAGRDEMLGLIRRVHTDFGISVLVTSHLLGELERTCDHVVVIDGGKLLRSSSTDEFTQVTASLAVEVTDTDTHPDGTGALRAALAAAGATVTTGAAGRRASPPPATCCMSRRPARRPTTWCGTPLPDSGSAWSGWNSAGTRSPRSSATRTRRRPPPPPQAPRAPRMPPRTEAPTMSPEPMTPASTTSVSAAPGGAYIHNIGYRHYDGPRLGRAYARRSLFSQSLRGAYGLGRSAKSKVLPMLLFAVMCPACRDHGRGGGVHQGLQPPGRLLPLRRLPPGRHRPLSGGPGPAVGLARSALQVDTAVLLPPHRAGRLRGREVRGDGRAPCFILTGVPLVVLYVGALLAKLDFVDQTKGLRRRDWSPWRCSRCCSPGSAWCSPRSHPRRGFGVAAVIAVLTIPYGAVSAVQGIAFGQGNEPAVGWLGLFSPITLIDGVQVEFLGGTSAFPDSLAPPTGAGFVYLLVSLAVIAGCYALLMRRYRKAGL